MIAWPADLINSIARRRVVLVVGSGVSKNSTNKDGKRPPNWEDFLKGCLPSMGGDLALIEHYIAIKDYLTACELIKNKMGDVGFVRKIREEFQLPGYSPAEIHQHIFDLDASIVLSPNFDEIYDAFAKSQSNQTCQVMRYDESNLLDYIKGGEWRVIVKMHGSVTQTGSLIFTRKQYAEARVKNKVFYESIKALVLTHTFLFLGCGTEDPDIRHIFEDLQFAHGSMPKHYMTMPNGELHQNVAEIISELMSVEFLGYSPANGHSELTASLKDLVVQVEEFRASLGQSQKW